MRRGWILVPAVLLLSACGGAMHKSAGSPPGSPKQTVQVSEREFAIMPNAINLSQAGTFLFRVTNNGKITHAFAIEGNGVDQKTSDIAPGTTASLTVRLGKGSYQAFCPIDGHRARGMLAKVTVGKAPLSGPGTTSTTTTTQSTTNQTTTSNPGY